MGTPGLDSSPGPLSGRKRTAVSRPTDMPSPDPSLGTREGEGSPNPRRHGAESTQARPEPSLASYKVAELDSNLPGTPS